MAVRKAKKIKFRAPRTHISKIIKPVQVMPNKRLILPGMIIWFAYNEKNISDIGTFLKSLEGPRSVSLISGNNVKKIVQRKIEKKAAVKPNI